MCIVFESVCCRLRKIVKISACLSKVYLAKGGAFLSASLYVSKRGAY